jgi:thiol-disulfide isomerase/thioredoxin
VEDNKDNGVTGAKLTAEFPDAVLNPKIEPAQFTWTESKDERYVRQVVPPLDPAEAPSKLLGKPVPDVTFVTSAGEKRDSKSLIGKVTVLDFWATFCPPCKEGMPEIEAVRKQYAGNDKVQFLALSTDGPDTSEAQIVETLKAIGVNPPWGRISAEEFFRQFEVDQTIPVLVILGANGTIQVLHIGLLKDTPTSLPAMIEAVLKGDDVIKQARDAWEARQREYQQQLQQATVDIHAAIVEIPRGKIAAATEPAAHKLVPLWTAADVTGPGNLLALPPLVSNASEPQSKHSPGPLDSRILVIDQMHDVVELNRAGKVVARHKQFIPNNPPLTWLRSAAEKDGQRFFVLGAVGQDQFYVFDGNWQLALKYPADPSAKIFDVQPGDLDGDGKLDFGIGYFGEAGVQAVSLAGKRLFNNATILDVTHLVIAPLNLTGERGLLCTHQGGTLVPIRSDGEAETPLQLSGHAISHVATADLDGDGRAEGCVLASATNESGSRQIAGLHLESAGWKFTWNRPIPSGEHELIIEAVSSGHIETGKPGIWIVAGADGSVHFFAADGTPVDQFNTGGILTGVATAVIEGKPALLVAHPDKLQAFRIEKK